MKNPCGTTKAYIFEQTEVNGIPVYLGSGVNPVNSPAQFFVAWGKGVLKEGLIQTFNSYTPEEGFLWFTDDEEAEAKYFSLLQALSLRKITG